MKITTQVTLASANIVSPEVDFAFNGTEINVPRTDITLTSQSITLQFVSGGIIGLTAYQLALKNGFVGTETEWLASLKGADGSKGVNYRGAYDSGSTYAVDDSVTYLGSSYVCLVDGTTGNPIDYPSRWTLFAKKGDDGVPGAMGPNNLYFGTYFPVDAIVPSVLVKYSGLTILDVIFRLPAIVNFDGPLFSNYAPIQIVLSNNNLTASYDSLPNSGLSGNCCSTTYFSSGKHYFSFRVRSTGIFSFGVVVGVANSSLDMNTLATIASDASSVMTGGIFANNTIFGNDLFNLNDTFTNDRVLTIFFDRDNNTWGVIENDVVFSNLQDEVGFNSHVPVGMASGPLRIYAAFILYDNNQDTVVLDLITTNNTNPALAGYSNMLG